MTEAKTRTTCRDTMRQEWEVLGVAPASIEAALNMADATPFTADFADAYVLAAIAALNSLRIHLAWIAPMSNIVH